MARLAAKQNIEQISEHFDDAHNEWEVNDDNAPNVPIYFHENGTNLHDGIYLSFELSIPDSRIKPNSDFLLPIRQSFSFSSFQDYLKFRVN